MALNRSTNYGLIASLLGLILVAGLSPFLIGEPDHAVSYGRRIISGVFFFGIPALLLSLTLMRVRWAFMAAVMYGTIGLALDISTVVQEVTKTESQLSVVLLSGLTGLLNFFLIAIGGRGFLDVLQPTSPPTSPHPNPRFPSLPE
jgi:hypothetical protein